MSRFHKVQQRIKKIQRELKAQTGQDLLDARIINPLRLHYEATGELPDHPLQRTFVLYLDAMHKAMRSTVPAGDDGSEDYRQCQEALRQAAIAFNEECQRWGLPPGAGEALP